MSKLGTLAAAAMTGAVMLASPGAQVFVDEYFGPRTMTPVYGKEPTPTTRRGAGPSRHSRTIANRAKRARARLSRKKG